MIYKSPVVYVVEKDIYSYTPPKNFRRIRKITRIFTQENKLYNI